MSDIFISYAREDKQHAAALADTFKAQGWSVWWDVTLRAGTVFDDEIERELGAARCVVVLWSRHSIASRWVRAEVEQGAQRGILLPVLVEAVVPPLSFRLIHAVDLSGTAPGDTSASLQQLLTDVASVLKEERLQTTPWQIRKARWAAILEKGSLEFAPVVIAVLAVLNAFSAITVVLLASALALIDAFLSTQRRDALKWLLLCAAVGEGVIAAVAATPGGYEMMLRQSKYLIVFIVARTSLASYSLRRLH